MINDDKVPPLCVDLDGTLTPADTLWEAVVLLARRRPLLVLALPWWLCQGRAVFKARVAQSVNLAEMALTWNEPLLAHLRAEYPRPLYLVSGANEAIVAMVARRLPIFSGMHASDGKTNLTRSAKRRRLVEQFGEGGYDYAGNDAKDLEAWAHARAAILVNADARLTRLARQRFNVQAVFTEKLPMGKSLLKCLRPHQWVKNLLVFVPLLSAHKLFDHTALTEAVAGFVAFCAVASAFYIFNDLFDLAADREHPHKRHRPLASGAVSIPAALATMAVMLVAGLALGGLVGAMFALVLLGYVALTSLYTFAIKRVPIADVVTLGGLYTIRIVGGGVAAGVELSSWLLTFSMFIFLSLGLAKRFTEIKAKSDAGGEEVAGRGYQTGDLELVSSLGTASGYIATLVLAFYVTSDKVKTLYWHPEILWAFVVLLLYWISRVWLIAHRGQLHHDPIVFALKDKVSYSILACVLAVMWLAGPK